MFRKTVNARGFISHQEEEVLQGKEIGRYHPGVLGSNPTLALFLDKICGRKILEPLCIWQVPFFIFFPSFTDNSQNPLGFRSTIQQIYEKSENIGGI